MSQDHRKAEGFLTPKMVAERVARLWKHNQWKQLYALCVVEPRARTQVLARRKDKASTSLLDIKVKELFEKVAALPDPAISQPPGYEVDLASMELALPTMPEEGVSIELTQELAPLVIRRLPAAFGDAIRAKEYVAAARALLGHLKTVGPGEPAGVGPMQLRELTAELATQDAFPLLMQLLGALPAYITAPAMEDLGHKLRLGAILQEPVEWFDTAIREAPDTRAQPGLEGILVASIRSVLEAL